MNKTLLSIVLLLIVFSCNAQTELPVTKEDPFYKVFPKEQYLEDLDEFTKTLTETHPHPYDFTSKEDFWNTVAEQKNKITDTTTFGEFLWYTSAIIANIGCSHTSLGYFSQEDRILPIELRFPVEARLIDNRLYISDPLINKNVLQVKSEVFSINGVPFEEVQNEIYKHIASQAKNKSFKRVLFNGFFTAYIPYALGFPEKYEIVVKGKEKPIVLEQLTEYQYKPRINPTAACQERLCLNIIQDRNTALVTIRSFAFYGAEKFQIFKEFIDTTFKEINSKNINNLIIDLRMNNGGPADAGIYLLRYLSNEPFTYFAQEADGTDYKDPVAPFQEAYSGKTYILINGENTSTAGHFLSLIKQKDLATLIGEEAGSNFKCTANQRRGVKLTNTGISFSVARNTYFTTAQDFPKDSGVLPDHNIVQDIEDFLNNEDTVLNYTLELIDND